jgi:hypothetical protein
MGLENNGGFRVDAFNDPVEAVSKFTAGKYDLLLLVSFFSLMVAAMGQSYPIIHQVFIQRINACNF